MATRSFTQAVREKAAGGLPDVEFEIKTGQPMLDDNDEEMLDARGQTILDPDTVKASHFTAHAPTAEQLAIALAHGAHEFATIADEMSAALELFRAVLPPQEYQVLVRRLRDPNDEVDIKMLGDIVSWLVEQWQDFPTQPPVGSSRSSKSISPRSTGRSPGKGSTRSK